jgi:hypothetical protein
VKTALASIIFSNPRVSGHSDIKTTMRCAKVAQKSLKKIKSPLGSL